MQLPACRNNCAPAASCGRRPAPPANSCFSFSKLSLGHPVATAPRFVFSLSNLCPGIRSLLITLKTYNLMIRKGVYPCLK